MDAAKKDNSREQTLHPGNNVQNHLQPLAFFNELQSHTLTINQCCQAASMILCTTRIPHINHKQPCLSKDPHHILLVNMDQLNE
jgi:hypothetical protein